MVLICPLKLDRTTVQCKIFEDCKFCGFRCFLSNCENEWMASHVAINGTFS